MKEYFGQYGLAILNNIARSMNFKDWNDFKANLTPEKKKEFCRKLEEIIGTISRKICSEN